MKRPAYCPKETPAAQAAPSPPSAPELPAPAEEVAAPVALEPPAPPPRAIAPQARPHSTPVRKAKSAIAPDVPPTAPAGPAVPALAASRTTHAFGAQPELRLDPVGAGLALATGGGALWLLRSGFAASLLLLGLPVWRDVDLVAVIADGDRTPAADDEDDADATADSLLTTPAPGVERS